MWSCRCRCFRMSRRDAWARGSIRFRRSFHSRCSSKSTNSARCSFRLFQKNLSSIAECIICFVFDFQVCRSSLSSGLRSAPATSASTTTDAEPTTTHHKRRKVAVRTAVKQRWYTAAARAGSAKYAAAAQQHARADTRFLRGMFKLSL